MKHLSVIRMYINSQNTRKENEVCW